MSALVTVDTTSGVPPWRQVRDQVGRLAGGPSLPVASRLPSVRQLATDLGLSAGTVARAYRELEEAGVVTTARRRGTVVAAGALPSVEDLAGLAAAFVASARAGGSDDPAVLLAVRAALAGS